MWLSAPPVMAELGILKAVVRNVTGCEMVPLDDPDLPGLRAAAGLPDAELNDFADIILFGPYGDRALSGRQAEKYRNNTVTIFIACENRLNSNYHDQMVGDVHISLNYRRDLTSPISYRLPWFLPYSVDKWNQEGSCEWDPLLKQVIEPEAWATRPYDVTLLSHHYAYPRPQLFEMINSTGGYQVHCPSTAYHNIEWPAGLPNSHLNGKIQFLTSYRFNICPENRKSGPVGVGGYNTEKLSQAHQGGTVPIYYGDQLDVEVFNPARVILFNGTNNATILDTMHALSTDPQARKRWFSEPILSSTADGWLHGWCATVSGMLEREFRALRARRRDGRPPAQA